MLRQAETSPKRIKLPRMSASDPRCLACGGRVTLDEHAVRVRGDVLHAACALYRPRRRA